MRIEEFLVLTEKLFLLDSEIKLAVAWQLVNPSLL